MTRLDYKRTHRLGMAAVLSLEAYSRSHNPGELYEMIELRASHLNGCRYCIDMHTRGLRKRGVGEDRIAALAGDLSPDLFDARERAALALTDAVTRLKPGGVSDEVWDAAAEHFSDQEMGNLVIAIATINVWNRINIATEGEQ